MSDLMPTVLRKRLLDEAIEQVIEQEREEALAELQAQEELETLPLTDEEKDDV